MKENKLTIHLLRGLIREKAHWDNFSDHLRRLLPEAIINFIEIPGTGEFYQMKSPTSLKEMVGFCRSRHHEVLKTPGVHLVVAISLGGMVVSEWLKNHPNDFQGAILINSSFKGFSPFFKRVKPKAILEFLKVALSFNQNKKEEIIVNLVKNNPKNKQEILALWRDIASKRPVSLGNAARQLLAAMTFTPLKSAPKAKTLIIAGKSDRLCDYSCSEKIFTAWGSQIAFHATAGHDLPSDDASWLAQRIQQFALDSL